ncbi:MAG: rhomboid family intramembrane serine protease [Pirellulales bacterium]
MSLIVVNTLLLILWPVSDESQSHPGSVSLNTAENVQVLGQINEQDDWKEDEEYVGVYTPDWRTLHYGRGLKPWQWLTSNFMHAGIGHLLSNMIFLWCFGLIVEGKLGWWKYLSLYLGIGVVQSAVEQTMMLGLSPQQYSLGASAAIFGLVAIALVWAPMNVMNCFFIIFFRVFFIEVPIYILASLHFAMECLTIYISFTYEGWLAPSSALLHMMGAIVGGALGVFMVKRSMVDCEGWDCFSVWAGKHNMSSEKLDELRRNSKDYQDKEQTLIQGGIQQIESILKENQDPNLAYRAHTKMRHRYQNWKLPDVILLQIIKLYCERKEFQAAIPAMVEYVKIPGEKSNQVRLRLANVLLQYEQRPNQAIKVLRKINQQELQEKEKQAFQKLLLKAGELRDQDDLLEASDEDW